MIKLIKTCDACPEQYDAYLDGKMVGYLRLRHGSFTVTCPDVGGVVVYEAEPDGDGIFEPEERDYYLRFAVAAILKWASGEWKPPEMPPAPDVQYSIEG